MNNPGSLAERLEFIRGRIARAARRASRDPSEIRVIAVSKGQPAERIEEAFAAGLREFGENYLEEALPKIRILDTSVIWHMIGHVQSRKAKGVAENFPVIHSVDSPALAGRLSRFAVERGGMLAIFLECNVSGEATKYGWTAFDPSTRGSMFTDWEKILTLPGLRVAGLMTMAPYSENPEASRPVFRRLRELRDLARDRLPSSEWAELSMGMSDDFEQAIEEGATIVRIGRALFGPRRM
jgi:pyridoxal phosphate enzyme (YggS family)